MHKRHALLLLVAFVPLLLSAQVPTAADIALLRYYIANTVPTFTVGNNPTAMAFDGQHMWVTNYGDSTVTEINVSEGAIVGTFPAPPNPFGVAYDGRYIWVASAVEGEVQKIEASTGNLSATYAIQRGSRGIAFDGTYMWIANFSHNCVTRIKAIDGSGARCISVGTQPVNVAFDGANIWVTNFGSNTVSVINADTGATVGTYLTGGLQPWGIAFDPNQGVMGVTNAGSNTVCWIASNGQLENTAPTGSVPRGIAYSGTFFWVANSSSESISRILSGSGSAGASYAVGAQPFGVAFDGTSVWVANRGTNTLSKR